VALAVFSHWVLDLVVHRPDLPLYDNAAKVGLWNYPAPAFLLEVAALFAGMFLYLRLSALYHRDDPRRPVRHARVRGGDARGPGVRVLRPATFE